jgi:hypothetical protein
MSRRNERGAIEGDANARELDVVSVVSLWSIPGIEQTGNEPHRHNGPSAACGRNQGEGTAKKTKYAKERQRRKVTANERDKGESVGLDLRPDPF